MMDSVTRVATAWREIGLSVGEPPTTRGYPPSVFAQLPRLLERAGTGPIGSITGLYTVLVEGDDFNEPVADATRSILDGHIVLSRKLAQAKHFPAVDVLESVSRVRDQVTSPDDLEAANGLLQLEALYRAQEDLVTVGAYKGGTDRQLDTAIEIRPALLELLRQRPSERGLLGDTRSRIRALAGRARQRLEGVA
jgi:flagellar biosynthesis/type III secretory pathway ATPase